MTDRPLDHHEAIVMVTAAEQLTPVCTIPDEAEVRDARSMLLRPKESDGTLVGASAVLNAMLGELGGPGQPKRGRPDAACPLTLVAYVKSQPCEADRAEAAAVILDLARLLGKVVADRQPADGGIGEDADAA